MAFNFIPAYSNFGMSINPDFRNRTLNMLSEHFGYDFDELEDVCFEYEAISISDGKHATDGFISFLLQAIECDLSARPSIEH